MALASSYKSGTVTLTAGGISAIGTGTNWTGYGVQAGDVFWAGGLDVAVASVDSATRITLAFPWAGPALTNAPYELRYTPDSSRVLAASRQAIAGLEDLRADVYAGANVFASTAAGLAATKPGDQFQVKVANELVRYRHDAGPVATEIARFMTAPAVAAAVDRAVAQDAALSLALRDAGILPLTNIGGTGDAITADLQGSLLAVGITTLSAIAEVEYIPVAVNAAANPTITIAGVTYGIRDPDGAAWPAGGFKSGSIYRLRRRNTVMRVIIGSGIGREDISGAVGTEATARANADAALAADLADGRTYYLGGAVDPSGRAIPASAKMVLTNHNASASYQVWRAVAAPADGAETDSLKRDSAARWWVLSVSRSLTVEIADRLAAVSAEAQARTDGDIAARARASHTGTQAITTVSGLSAALDGLSQSRQDGDAAEAQARGVAVAALSADIAALRPQVATITAASGGGERNAATWTRAPATRRITAAQIAAAPAAAAQPATATVTTAPHPDGAVLTWADDSGDSWRAVWSSASNTLGPWALITRRPDAGDLTVTLTETSTPVARDLSGYTTSGATLAINPAGTQSIINNAPALVGTKPQGARAWTIRESGQMVQYFQEASGRRWRRIYDGAAWSVWAVTARLSGAAGRATIMSAAAAIARTGAVPRALRGEMAATADLYIAPPVAAGGAVASLLAGGEWGAALAPVGSGTAPAQVAGGYRFGGVELATGVTTYAAPAPALRMDAFVDFTADAQPPSGAHYIAAFSTAPATRFALSMLGEGAGYFSLSLKLPGDVIIEDRSMIYPVGARVQAALGADFAGGTGYLTQTGLVRKKPFAPPGSLLVQQLRLGASCQITLHEIAVFAR